MSYISASKQNSFHPHTYPHYYTPLLSAVAAAGAESPFRLFLPALSAILVFLVAVDAAPRVCFPVLAPRFFPSLALPFSSVVLVASAGFARALERFFTTPEAVGLSESLESAGDLFLLVPLSLMTATLLDEEPSLSTFLSSGLVVSPPFPSSSCLACRAARVVFPRGGARVLLLVALVVVLVVVLLGGI